MASLSIRDVYKTYANGVPVLKGVNIDIEDGQFLILVGGSGCGKSTLLNMIAGLETVTKGDIMIDGKTVNNLSPKDRDIAMVLVVRAVSVHDGAREHLVRAEHSQGPEGRAEGDCDARVGHVADPAFARSEAG